MKRKIFVASILAFCAMLLTSVTALANDVGIADLSNTLDLADVIGTGLSAMVSEIFAVLVVILPIALTLIGAVIAIRKGISLIRSLVS